MENRKETITSAKTRNQRNAERRINASSLKKHLLHYRVCFYSCQLVARFPINELHTRRKEDNHSYLEPNSDSMQKPIGGRSVLALFSIKRILENNSQKFIDKFPCTSKTTRAHTQGSPNIAQIPPIGSTPQAIGDRGLSWSTEVFQLTPRFHQTHLLWEPLSRKTGMAASFQERLRA